MPESINKPQLHHTILSALEALTTNAKAAMLRAYETATHEENVAENKYDTLGLEAAYLTQGQARRLAECEADLLAFQQIAPVSFSPVDAIAIGALVQLLDETGSTQFLFLAPAAGGVKVTLDEKNIVVVTPSAPLGKAVMGKHVGDEFVLQLGARQKRFEVEAIF